MAHSGNSAVIATAFLHPGIAMMNTSTEQLILLRQLPAPAIPGREDKPVRTCTLRSWCTVGVRGIRLESLKVQGKHYTTIEAWNRFFQALTEAAATTTKRGRTPLFVGSRTDREQIKALRQDVARLRTECKRRFGDGSNGEPFRSSVTRLSSPMLEALALERLPHRQLKILLALESLTRDKTRCFLGNRDFARLTAMSVRSLQKALADLVDQLRDMTRRLEESGKHGPFNE
jgi:Protein of unknown function (DUF1580)